MTLVFGKIRVLQETPLNKSHLPLRLNVGFLIKENAGYSRELTFHEPVVFLGDDLSVNNLQGALTLTRTPQGLYVQGKLRATTAAECVLCLKPFEQTVTSRLGEMFYYPLDTAPRDGLAIPEDMNLDLTPLVREDMLLSMPIRLLHSPECKGLCPVCGQDWNEGPCEHMGGQARIDPRLDDLRKLLKDNPDE
jgi:uncharacterized protein